MLNKILAINKKEDLLGPLLVEFNNLDYAAGAVKVIVNVFSSIALPARSTKTPAGIVNGKAPATNLLKLTIAESETVNLTMFDALPESGITTSKKSFPSISIENPSTTNTGSDNTKNISSKCVCNQV
jgi:hypothetical protein